MLALLSTRYLDHLLVTGNDITTTAAIADLTDEILMIVMYEF